MYINKIKNTKKTKLLIEITNTIFKKDDFMIFGGYVLKDYPEQNINMYDNVSIKTNGIQISTGQKEIVGILGAYQGRLTIDFCYENVDLNSRQSQINILSTIDGIQEITANKILDKLPENSTIEIFRDENLKVDGISKVKSEKIRAALNFFDSMQTLKELNILLGKDLSQKAIASLSENLEISNLTIDDFKKNPYQILIEQIGYSFPKTDTIAMKLGINFLDSIRIKYFTEYMVKKQLDRGSCYVELNKLKEEIKKYNCFKSDSDCEKSIKNNDRLVLDGTKVYTDSMYNQEIESAKMINEFLNKKYMTYKIEEIEKILKSFEKEEDIKLHKTQKESVIESVNNPIVIITGGAGTGKSTVLKAVIYVLNELRFNCVLSAPTGKAARRLAETTSRDTSTIHRFIFHDYSFGSNKVKVIDEFSMVDLSLFHSVLELTKDFKKLIFVGDPGQLPSVQSGNCLHDLILSDKIKVIKLTKIFRQAKNSNIIDVSNKVNDNMTFDFMKKSDFFVRECKNNKSYIDAALYYYEYLRNKYDSIDTFYNDVQFIIPLKGDKDSKVLEVKANYFNKLIKNKYNPKKNKKDWFKFDINDKIMNLENNSELDIYNGEVGRITAIDDTTFTIYFFNLDRFVTINKSYETMQKFQLAYCCTVHKLQGSEYKYICLIISENNPFLDSTLLYTGLTRGKQTVILLSEKDIIDSIVKRKNVLKRKTFLKDRIINECNKIKNGVI